MPDDVPGFTFANERDAASRIKDAASANGVRLYPLPYSRFDPDRSTWWLAPTSANPAYSVGKLVVERPTLVDDGSKLIGLHMEKGVGPKAAPFFAAPARARRLVMDRTWTWHPFARAMREGDLDEQIIHAETASEGLTLRLEVVAAVQGLPSLDGADERPIDSDSVERVRYRIGGGVLTRETARVKTKLTHFADSESASSIGHKIDLIEDLDCTWVEILVGVPFRPVAEAAITPTDLWRRVCAPWSQWLR